MNSAEEKFNALGNSAVQFIQEKKLNEALEELRTALDLAINSANYASVEDRSKWIQLAEQVLKLAEDIEDAIKKEKTYEDNKSDNSPESQGEIEADCVLAIRPKERLTDVSGMHEAKDKVYMSVIEPLSKPDKAKKYGLKLGGGLLLYGLPGTGKTFFAKAVAGELGLPFYVIKSGDILCKYLGESEKIVKKIFDTARSNPMSVIYIDETNGILPSRSNDSVHEVSKRIAEIILQETDGIDSKEKNPFLLIGSTNYPDKIDDAALSRFSACIEVELPSEETRRFILQKELGIMEISIDDAALNLLIVKTVGFSCRDLVNLAAYYRETSAKEEISKFSLEFCEKYFKDIHVTSSSIAEGIETFKQRIGQTITDEKKNL